MWHATREGGRLHEAAQPSQHRHRGSGRGMPGHCARGRGGAFARLALLGSRHKRRRNPQRRAGRYGAAEPSRGNGRRRAPVEDRLGHDGRRRLGPPWRVGEWRVGRQARLRAPVRQHQGRCPGRRHRHRQPGDAFGRRVAGPFGLPHVQRPAGDRRRRGGRRFQRGHPCDQPLAGRGPEGHRVRARLLAQEAPRHGRAGPCGQQEGVRQDLRCREERHAHRHPQLHVLDQRHRASVRQPLCRAHARRGPDRRRRLPRP